MKLEIELTEEQLQLIINALEINFRIMMKQGGIVANLLAECPDKSKFQDDEKAWDRVFERYLTSRDNAAKVLNTLSEILYKDNSLPEYTHRLSDMWSALRHAQYQLHPRSEYDVRSREPFKMSDWEMIKAEIVKEENHKKKTQASSGFGINKDDIVIFLDIDGVLNHIGVKKETNFTKESIDVLNKFVLEHLNVKFVLCSTWKEAYTLERINNILEENGAHFFCVDKTQTFLYEDSNRRYSVNLADIEADTSPCSREKEIKSYIQIHDIRKYVILEDDCVFQDEELQKRHVKPNYYDAEKGGLRWEHFPLIQKAAGV